MNVNRTAWCSVPWTLALALLVFGNVACNEQGGEGQPCKCGGCGILSGGDWYCDDGLICNQGDDRSGSYTCDRAHSEQKGGVCWPGTAAEVCAIGLTCQWFRNGSHSWACGVPGTCSVDSTITRCSGTSVGYSCTGSAMPDQAEGSSLSCNPGVPDPNGTSTDVCCTDAFLLSPTSRCTPDSKVTGCNGTSVGYSCTGPLAPDVDNSSLSCSAGIFDGSGPPVSYCCTVVADSGSGSGDTSDGATACTNPMNCCSALGAGDADAGVACTGADATGD